MASSTGSVPGSLPGEPAGLGKRGDAHQQAAAGRRGNGGSLLRRAPASAARTTSTTLVPRGEALMNLKKLLEALTNTSQGDNEATQRLETQIQGLAADELVRHPERDVRLCVAQCLAEVFRIHAPNPPFREASQLRSIMVLFIEQLNTLMDTSLFTRGLGLLERLSEVCAFMLIFDCADQDELLVDLVEVCIGVARGSTSERLEAPLFQVLSSVLSEADEVPKCVWGALVELLTTRGRNPRAASLARRVLGALANRSAAVPINEFLNASLYAAPKQDEDAAQHMIESEANHQRNALLAATVELFKIDPSLTGRVLPNLQADLQCSNAERRQAVTKCMGEILAHHHAGSSSEPLMIRMPILFDKFLERLGDADESVRLAALDGVEAMLVTAVADSNEEGTHSGTMMNIVRRIGNELKTRCLDPNEEVRIRVVHLASKIAESATGLGFVYPVLPVILHRVLDKKPRVRDACIDALGHLYAQHALPAWIDGQQEQAEKFAFVPQHLCEAYAVFSASRLGHTIELETCLEEHVLGCGRSADQRGLALAGLLASVAGHDVAKKGLYQLLARKRDGHAALRCFLQVRSRGCPVLSPESALRGVSMISGAAGTTPGSRQEAVAITPAGPLHDADAHATMAVEALARVSPLMEDRNSRIETHVKDLRGLDLVRDRALWKVLDQLTKHSSTHTTSTTSEQMVELDDLLRRKGLEDLRPLLRRCLLTPWLLSDQVSSLLDQWDGSSTSGISMVVQAAVAELATYFPGPFLPHVPRIAEHLKDTSIDSVHAALRALASLGKRHTSISGAESPAPASPSEFASDLLEAVERLCGTDSSASDSSSVCRKALRTLGVLPDEAARASMAKILDWSTKNASVSLGSASSIALRLVAACFDWSLEVLPCRREWIARARAVLHDRSTPTDFLLQCAAVELLAAAGDATELTAVFESCDDASLRLHACSSALRAIRRGTLVLNTGILQHMACETCAAFALDRVSDEVSGFLEALQKLLKPASAFPGVAPSAHVQLKQADRVRLCSTLPALFAQSPVKRHREMAQRLLQSSLARASRQSRAQQLPLVDFAVAYFLHFLARVPAFIEEANLSASAFQESTRISTLFVEALLRADQPKSYELARIVLRVTERVRLFVDKEDPTSDKVQKAAYVLKYVVEKLCPQIGAIDKTLQGVSRGCMPGDLFADPKTVHLPLPSSQQHRPTLTLTQESSPMASDRETATHVAMTAGPSLAAATPASVVPRRLSFPSTAGRDSTGDLSAAGPATLLRTHAAEERIHGEQHGNPLSGVESSQAKRRRTTSPQLCQ